MPPLFRRGQLIFMQLIPSVMQNSLSYGLHVRRGTGRHAGLKPSNLLLNQPHKTCHQGQEGKCNYDG